MKVPLSAIYDDTWIDLRGDRYADPDGDNPNFSEPLLVFVAYQGGPRSADEMNASQVKYLGEAAPPEEEETGFTMLVSPGHRQRSMLLYFPDDQHEVTYCSDQKDDDDDDDEG